MKHKALTLLWVLLGIVLPVTSIHAQILTVTNNLVLWLKADGLSLTNGAAVSSWTDNSTNLNHATQGTGSLQPTFVTNGIGGRPAVRFDGANDFLATTRVALPLGLTYVAVFRTTVSDTISVYEGNAPLTIIGDHTSSVVNSLGLDGGDAQFNTWAPWSSLNHGSGLTNGLGHAMIATYAPNTANLYVDASSGVSLVKTYQTLYMGFDRISGGYPNNGGGGTDDLFSGDLAEILIYNSVLSSAQRKNLEAYLDVKYLLGIPEPSTVTLLGIGSLLLVRRLRK